MAAILKITFSNETEICCLPFVAPCTLFSIPDITTIGNKIDFVNVACGDARKNHAMLLKSWHLLAEAGIKPSFAWTVDLLTFPAISDEISRCSKDFTFDINNLGQLSPTEIINLYHSSFALSYPSKTESFRLPLIEARHHGFPILASELDYVRDVVAPVKIFDPNSPVSIARAVRLYIGKTEPSVHSHSSEDFLIEVLK